MIVGKKDGKDKEDPSTNLAPVKKKNVTEYHVNGRILTVEKDYGWAGMHEGFYRDYYPELIYAWATEGISINEMNVRLCVTRSAFYKWVHRYPDFGQAVEYAKLCFITAKENLAWKHLIEDPKGPKINTHLFRLLMAALDRENYAHQSHTATVVEEIIEAQKVVEVSSNIRDTFSKIEDRLRQLGPTKAPVVVDTEAKAIDKSLANQKIAKVASEKAKKKRS